MINIRKRSTIISIVVLFLVIMAIGSLLISQRIWSDYETGYKRHFSSVKTDISKVILQPLSVSGANSANKLKSIVQTQTKLTRETKVYCDINPFIRWQGFINQYSSNINDCMQQKNILAQLLDKVGNVTKYLEFEQQLAAIITNANNKTNQNNQPDKWDKIEAFWRKAVTDTSKLAATDQFKVVKTLAINNLTKIADAWRQLSSANDAKNRQQFTDARSSLGQTYTLLPEIATSSKTQVEKIISDLNRDYQKIQI